MLELATQFDLHKHFLMGKGCECDYNCDKNETIGSCTTCWRRKIRRDKMGRFSCLLRKLIFSCLFSWADKQLQPKRKVEENIMLEKVNCAQSSGLALEESGQQRKEASFNLGIELELFRLIAASANEFTKMKELRRQMKMLLQNFKYELQSQRATTLPKYKLSNLDDNVAASTSELVLAQNFSFLNNVEDDEISVVYDQSINCDKTGQEGTVEERDHLEAELEAELERLQLHLEFEEHLQQQSTEIMIEGTAPEDSLSASYGEVVELPQTITFDHYGVSPSELERRLHELLQMRQQEKIDELEAALKCAMNKLQEKENDISWWKDTAKLVSRRVPRTPRFLRQTSSPY